MLADLLTVIAFAAAQPAPTPTPTPAPAPAPEPAPRPLRTFVRMPNLCTAQRRILVSFPRGEVGPHSVRVTLRVRNRSWVVENAALRRAKWLRRLPRRVFRVRARVLLDDGRVLRHERRFLGCPPPVETGGAPE